MNAENVQLPFYRLYLARYGMESAHTHDGPPLPWAAIVRTWHAAIESAVEHSPRIVYTVRQAAR